jgi:lipoprotein-anchoring transpeptidase ErfK/SrfK
VLRPSLRLISAVIAVGLLLTACSSGGGGPEAQEVVLVPPTGPEVIKSDCDPRVADYPYHVAWAKSTGELPIYDQPGATTPVTTLSNPRLTDSDPPIPVELAMLVAQEPADCTWVQVDLPVRPNGSTGWVKREDIQMEGHVYRIEIRLSDFNLKLYQGDEPVLDVPIATATDNTPTPGGTYYTTELLTSSDPDGLYGPYAIGLSGYSDTLTSFNGGAGQLGIHGTNEPDKIGTQVSHGCIRLHNDSIQEMVRLLSGQTLGTPVYVYA